MLTAGVRQLAQALAELAPAILLGVALPAHASLVSVTGGFTSFSGTVGSDGQFETVIDNNVVCPDAGCGTGIGVASLSFGTPLEFVEFYTVDFGTLLESNEVLFTPAPLQDVLPGQEFLLGTLTYTNGIWFSDPDFGFTLTTQSLDPALDGLVFQDTLHLFITTNAAGNTPFQNADFVYFLNNTALGSVRAFELFDSPVVANSVTVDVYGRISSLHVTRFDNAVGGGFIDPSVGAQPSVPEPAALALLTTGLLGLARAGRRAR